MKSPARDGDKESVGLGPSPVLLMSQSYVPPPTRASRTRRGLGHVYSLRVVHLASTRSTSGGWSFRAFGFNVSVPWDALLGIVIIAVLWFPEFTGGYGSAGQWALAVVFAILLTGSVLLHELAHAFAARALGYPVAGITLWVMGGFTRYRTGRRHGPGREAAIAVAGPAATLTVAVLSALAADAVSGTPIARDLLSALAWANGLVGVFNLLPGSPLDGGAIVKSIVWAATGSATRGQVAAGWLGRVIACLIGIAPFLLALAVGGRPSLTLIVVALAMAFLLWTGASASLRQARSSARLSAVPAVRLSQPVDVIPIDTTVAESLARRDPGVLQLVLDREATPVGVVLAAAADAVPEDQRGRVDVMTVSIGLSGLPFVDADGTANDVVAACQEHQTRFVAVRGSGPGDQVRLIDTDAVFVTEGP